MKARLTGLWRRRPRAPTLTRGALGRELSAIPRTAADWLAAQRGEGHRTTPRPMATWVDRAFVLAHLRKIGGYIPENLGAEDVLALAVVKDEAERIEAFLEHHLALGVRGVVLIDNGSEDETVELARRYAPVLVLSCPLPFRTYVRAMRAVLQEQFGRGCWALSLDADEHFDYPASDRLSLGRLARYLNAQGANLMLTNMLEVFGQGELRSFPEVRGRALVQAFRFYDLSDLERRPPPAPLIAPEGIWAHAHGIRRRAFGRERGHLHKLSLAFFRGGLEPWHLTGHHLHGGYGRLADVTGTLYHYRFTGTLEDRCRAQIASRAWAGDSEKAAEYLAKLEARPDLDLYAVAPEPRELSGPDALVEAGQMYASEAFSGFAEANERTRKVFCIGFHKTGTTSMGTLLRHLGYKTLGNFRTRDRAFVADLAAGRLDDLFFVADRAHAFEDNPWPLFFRELDARYPGSRFILTTRDLDRWITSLVKHFGAQADPDSPMRRLIYGQDAGDPRGHEARYVARHQAHLDAVRAHFAGRPDALLEVDISEPDALGRICKFLGHETELTEMPHDNRAARL